MCLHKLVLICKFNVDLHAASVEQASERQKAIGPRRHVLDQAFDL